MSRHQPFGKTSDYVACIEKADSKRIAKLIKVVRMLTQTKTYLFWREPIRERAKSRNEGFLSSFCPTISLGEIANLGRKALSSKILLTLLVTGLLASVLVVTPSTASTASEPPKVEWDKTYGGADNEGAYSVQQTSDGGYIIAGHTSPFSGANADCWLVKTSSTGAMQWNLTFGSEDLWDKAHSVQQTNDGGYIFAGYSELRHKLGISNDFLLVKISSTGTKEWSRTYEYGEPNELNTQERACSVLQTSDGGYLVGGTTETDYFAGSSFNSFWLVKTNSAGAMEWNQTYGEARARETAYCVQQTIDGGYIIAGETNYVNSLGNGEYDFLLVKVNGTGAMQWSQKYDGGKYEYANSVQQTSDGGYIIAGFAGSKVAPDAPGDCWLVKTNSAGVVEWNRTCGGALYGLFYSVVEASDGGYAVAGSNGVGSWLFRTSTTGTVKWNQTYSGGVVVCLQKTRDGGYVMAGIGGFNFWLMKLEGNDADEDGLLDSWEKYGIDSDDDSIVDLQLKDADWQHKDIFVEVDYMPGHYPDADAMDDVKQAFANAPVTNPDGSSGIRLHVDIDESIPHMDTFRAFDYVENDFDTLKSSYFGTPIQHISGNKNATIAAKKLAYRYCLFIHDYSRWNGTHWVSTGSGGLAECPGNDFIVSLGSFTGGKGTRDEHAGTFMHELGHTLGLRHGGGDDINYKPNYLSVMSYTFQTSKSVPWRPLDYSRKALPTLREGALNEPLGIQYLGFWLYTVWNNSKEAKYGLTSEPKDWNGNGNWSDVLVRANINNFPGWGYSSAEDEFLDGYDDWANVRLDFKDTQGFADGVHSETSGEEITSDILEAMLQWRLAQHGVAVFNLTSPIAVWGQGNALSVSLALGNLGGFDENANLTVYANTTVIASGSFTVKADNLTQLALPYNGQALTPGNYTLKAVVSPVAQETYTADNTALGGIITVTEVIPEFPAAMMLTVLLTLTLAVTLAFRRKAERNKE